MRINTSLWTSTHCFVFDSGLNVLDSRPSKSKALINAFSVNASPPIRSALYHVPLLTNEDECKNTQKTPICHFLYEKNAIFFMISVDFGLKSGKTLVESRKYITFAVKLYVDYGRERRQVHQPIYRLRVQIPLRHRAEQGVHARAHQRTAAW